MWTNLWLATQAIVWVIMGCGAGLGFASFYLLLKDKKS